MAQAKSRGDDWGQCVQTRLANVIDLVAVEARYHDTCRKDFFSQPTEEICKVGRPEDVHTKEASLELCSFLEGNDEC